MLWHHQLLDLMPAPQVRVVQVQLPRQRMAGVYVPVHLGFSATHNSAAGQNAYSTQTAAETRPVPTTSVWTHVLAHVEEMLSVKS
jgi:hypothetical protein